MDTAVQRWMRTSFCKVIGTTLSQVLHGNLILRGKKHWHRFMRQMWVLLDQHMTEHVSYGSKLLGLKRSKRSLDNWTLLLQRSSTERSMWGCTIKIKIKVTITSPNISKQRMLRQDRCTHFPMGYQDMMLTIKLSKFTWSVIAWVHLLSGIFNTYFLTKLLLRILKEKLKVQTKTLSCLWLLLLEQLMVHLHL